MLAAQGAKGCSAQGSRWASVETSWKEPPPILVPTFFVSLAILRRHWMEVGPSPFVVTAPRGEPSTLRPRSALRVFLR